MLNMMLCSELPHIWMWTETRRPEHSPEEELTGKDIGTLGDITWGWFSELQTFSAQILNNGASKSNFFPKQFVTLMVETKVLLQNKVQFVQ